MHVRGAGRADFLDGENPDDGGDANGLLSVRSRFNQP